jgi:phage baseplate assembly protein W
MLAARSWVAMTTPRHPLRRASTRQLALADPERHIADLVRLVLLCGPGERLHRPEFGAGLGAAALFEPLDGALRSVIEIRARGSLERSLGDRIEVLGIDVTIDGSTVRADVRYRLRPAGDERQTLVTLGGGDG